jgi:hypothetical protein
LQVFDQTSDGVFLQELSQIFNELLILLDLLISNCKLHILEDVSVVDELWGLFQVAVVLPQLA